MADTVPHSGKSAIEWQTLLRRSDWREKALGAPGTTRSHGMACNRRPTGVKLEVRVACVYLLALCPDPSKAATGREDTSAGLRLFTCMHPCVLLL